MSHDMTLGILTAVIGFVVTGHMSRNCGHQCIVYICDTGFTTKLPKIHHVIKSVNKLLQLIVYIFYLYCIYCLYVRKVRKGHRFYIKSKAKLMLFSINHTHAHLPVVTRAPHSSRLFAGGN